MAATKSPEASSASRAQRKLESDYRSSVAYFLAGLVVLAAGTGLFLTGLARGSLVDFPIFLIGMGATTAVLGVILIGINGWLLKRRWPQSPLPGLR